MAPDAVLCTDGFVTDERIAKDEHIPHVALNAGRRSKRTLPSHHITTVTAPISRFRAFMQPFCGPASRTLAADGRRHAARNNANRSSLHALRPLLQHPPCPRAKTTCWHRLRRPEHRRGTDGGIDGPAAAGRDRPALMKPEAGFSRSVVLRPPRGRGDGPQAGDALSREKEAQCGKYPAWSSTFHMGGGWRLNTPHDHTPRSPKRRVDPYTPSSTGASRHARTSAVSDAPSRDGMDTYWIKGGL